MPLVLEFGNRRFHHDRPSTPVCRKITRNIITHVFAIRRHGQAVILAAKQDSVVFAYMTATIGMVMTIIAAYLKQFLTQAEMQGCLPPVCALLRSSQRATFSRSTRRGNNGPFS